MLRQFRLTRRPATNATAEAWQLLQSLPLPIDLPDFARKGFSEQGLRCIFSIAMQYHSPTYSVAQLAQAGHAALVAAALRYREKPQQWERFGAWWVRQGVLNFIQSN